MRRICWLGMLACLVTSSVWYQGSAASLAAEPRPWPDDGAVANGIYTNKYFDLSYPLPSGWTQAMAGPGPSASGYYVLATASPTGEPTGAVLIAAQDVFFADAALGDLREAARQFTRSMSQIAGMTIDRQPSEGASGGRLFSRVDVSGVGLFRSTFITHSRCHLVSFNLTASSPERLAALVLSM